MASNTIINAMITVDTVKVLELYPNPSLKEKEPTVLHLGENCAFMVVSGATEVTGQGTWSLKFTAGVGDVLRGFALSCSNNLDDAVLLYGFSSTSTTSVTTPFKYEDFTTSGIVGGKDTALPAVIIPEAKFWFFQATVNKTGRVTFNVNFALYTRVKGKLTLKGYYSWDPTIEVLG